MVKVTVDGCRCCGFRIVDAEGWCGTCRDRGHHQNPELVAYVRGWRKGYGQGRDDEAAAADLRQGPAYTDPELQRLTSTPRDRQRRDPGRDR